MNGTTNNFSGVKIHYKITHIQLHWLHFRKLIKHLSDHHLSHFSCSNKLQLLKCEDVLLLPVLYYCKYLIFAFLTVGKLSKSIWLHHLELWEIVMGTISFWHFIDWMLNLKINQQKNRLWKQPWLLSLFTSHLYLTSLPCCFWRSTVAYLLDSKRCLWSNQTPVKQHKCILLFIESHLLQMNLIVSSSSDSLILDYLPLKVIVLA